MIQTISDSGLIPSDEFPEVFYEGSAKFNDSDPEKP